MPLSLLAATGVPKAFLGLVKEPFPSPTAWHTLLSCHSWELAFIALLGGNCELACIFPVKCSDLTASHCRFQENGYNIPVPTLPDVKGCVEHVGFLQFIQLHLGIAHLVVHTFQLIIQLQLLPLELTVLLLIPLSKSKTRCAECWLLDQSSSSMG